MLFGPFLPPPLAPEKLFLDLKRTEIIRIEGGLTSMDSIR
jgi:hypothetical protein